MNKLRILTIHGVGGHEQHTGWQNQWKDTIHEQLALGGVSSDQVEIEALAYDEHFAADPLDPGDMTEALIRLSSSWLWTGISGLFRRRRGWSVTDLPDKFSWTAGMVVKWVDDDHNLRSKTRKALADHIGAFDPHLICAHSLGALVLYDTYRWHRSGSDLFKGRTVLTFGTQIGHPSVRSQFGRVTTIRSAANWFHAYNKHDIVFTAQIRLSDANYQQLDAEFDEDGSLLNHDADLYLSEPEVTSRFWVPLASDWRSRTTNAQRSVRKPLLPAAPAAREAARSERRRQKKALLIGIDAYSDAPLEGCVNDAFLVSSVLQECGFEAEDIRLLLDERATAEAIRERIDWLLADALPGDVRVLGFSGHGACLPTYNAAEVVDGKDECLCPVDFDFSMERSITDDWLVTRYCDLPADVSFTMVLDCCHSGGLDREPGRRIRGLRAPDDIRHRAMRWDPKRELWVDRKLDARHRALDKLGGDAERFAQQVFGEQLDTFRIGRGGPQRQDTTREYNKARKRLAEQQGDGTFPGPYMPVIITSAREHEYAFEYRHGATSYGAFSYVAAKTLRALGRRKRVPTYSELVAAAGKELDELGYDQQPDVIGPSAVIDSPVPWLGGGSGNARA